MTELDELPELVAADSAAVVGRAVLDGVLLADADLSGTNAAQVRMIECALTGCRADTLEFPGLTAVDAYIGALSAGTWGMRDSEWRDATWADIRVGALMADGASIVETTVRGSKVDLFSLRGATLKRVTLIDCSIGTLDISMASIDHLEIRGGRVGELLSDDARMTGVDASTTALGSVGHPGSLRGLVLSPEQVGDLAEALAEHLGIAVRP